jgi:riboflavin kinase / FMN adenylyltransferase
MPAAISVGANPTFAGQRDRRVEAHVIDRGDLDLYGREVEVVFVHRLRGMARFGSAEELVAAMGDDVSRARELLEGRAAPDEARAADEA